MNVLKPLPALNCSADMPAPRLVRRFLEAAQARALTGNATIPYQAPRRLAKPRRTSSTTGRGAAHFDLGAAKAGAADGEQAPWTAQAGARPTSRHLLGAPKQALREQLPGTGGGQPKKHHAPPPAHDSPRRRQPRQRRLETKDALARTADGHRPRGPRRGARQFTAGPADTVDDALPVRPAPDAWLRRCRVKDETAPGASKEFREDGVL